MGKIRDWMHGKGRGVVIAVVILLALWIIVDFYRTNHPKPEQKEPAKISEPYEGSSSSSEGNVRTPGDTEEDTQDEKQENSQKLGDSSDGQTVTEETAGKASDEDTSKEDPELDTTEEDTKDSGLTTTEEDTGTRGEASQTENGDITIGFAGDINLDETWTVMKHMRQKGKGIQGCIDPRLIRKMRSCDYMVLNNEFSISNRGKAMKGKAYTFRAPRRNVKLLRQLGVDAVSLANNHVYDYGERAFLDTLSAKPPVCKLVMKLAREAEVDLVKVAPSAKPPVCKLVDYGKYKYELVRKEKEAKKKQRTIEVKEVRLSPNIDVNDLNTKCNSARKFIEKGNKVKVSLRFRGREMAHIDSSKHILEDFAEKLSDIAVVDKAPKLEGRSMTMFLTEKR